MSHDTPAIRPKGTTYNLLFVCTGNTCRSPMAEAIASGMIAERGWTHVAVKSAGAGAVPGAAASPAAVDVAGEHDLDLSAHASQPLTPELIEWADLVLCMGPSHMQAVLSMGAADRATLVTSFIDGDHANLPVADPYGGDHDTYREAFEQLSIAITALLERLEPILAP